MPTALLTRPELDVIDISYLEAYYTLTGSRQTGMSVGAIPLSEIEAYVRLLGVPNWFETDDMNIKAFVEVITKVDNSFLVEHHKEQEAQAKKKPVKK